MRVVLVLALLAHTAAADPMLSEWSAETPFRRAEQLSFGACTLHVAMRGAIAELEMQQVVLNTGNTDMAGQLELDLPAKAEMIGASFDEPGVHSSTAVGVAVNPAIEGASDALGADPMLVVRDGLDHGKRRFRVMLQPVRAQHQVAVGVRWVIAAEIYNGALHVALPARLDRSTCTATVTARPGPGATAKVAQPGFAWGADDTMIDVALSVGKAPVAWVQTADLGNGEYARALTVIAPAVRAKTGAHRVVLAIDTSRSMELIGRGNVRRMVKAIVAALPQGARVQAVVFDRTAERVTKTWLPAESSAAEIDAALAKRGAVNGSDIAAAFELVKTALAEPGDEHGQAMVIAITDGVFGGVTLDKSLGGRADALDLHAIVLDPTGMTSPDGDALRPLVGFYGGTYVEVPLDEFDHAIADAAEWLRPAWQNLELTGMAGVTLPEQIRAGTGFVQWSIGPRPQNISLAARGETRVKSSAAMLPAAPIAQLALEQLGDSVDDAGEKRRAELTQRFPAVDDEHDLAVLTTRGRVAAQRRQMIAGGGPYTRMVDVPDQGPPRPAKPIAGTRGGGSSLDQIIVKRMLNDQLKPRAYSCYARQLGLLNSLTGDATFAIELGRGEVTRVTVTGFEANAEFHACLLDAAYGLAPPMPTPGYNLDDRAEIGYALRFRIHDEKPDVASGTETVTPRAPQPSDGNHPKLDVGDTSTPLGALKPNR